MVPLPGTAEINIVPSGAAVVCTVESSFTGLAVMACDPEPDVADNSTSAVVPGRSLGSGSVGLGRV